jgi:hypothetical protein
MMYGDRFDDFTGEAEWQIDRAAARTGRRLAAPLVVGVLTEIGALVTLLVLAFLGYLHLPNGTWSVAVANLMFGGMALFVAVRVTLVLRRGVRASIQRQRARNRSNWRIAAGQLGWAPIAALAGYQLDTMTAAPIAVSVAALLWLIPAGSELLVRRLGPLNDAFLAMYRAHGQDKQTWEI